MICKKVNLQRSTKGIKVKKTANKIIKLFFVLNMVDCPYKAVGTLDLYNFYGAAFFLFLSLPKRPNLTGLIIWSFTSMINFFLL